MKSLLIDDITTPFTPQRFSMARLPARVGKVTQRFFTLPSCLDMLIKLPKGNIHIPAPYTKCYGLQSFLSQAFAFEDEILPSWRETHYAYLTFDQRLVLPGKTHRNAGWHFDGMQGARYREKLNACHQYVCAAALPTEFSSHPTSAQHLDENKDNWFLSLGAQVPPTHTPWSPQPYQIIAMSAYQLHRSPVATVPTPRTFIRLDISLKQQDRKGNSLNPDLPAPWTFHERDLPKGLGTNINDSGWKNGSRFS